MKKFKLEHRGSVDINTPRLLLRKITIDDHHDIYRNINHDKDVLKYFGAAYYDTYEESSIERLIELSAKQDCYCWGIEKKDNKECIGIILEQESNEQALNIELGYAIGSIHWNNGYITEALNAVIDFLFEKIGYHKITAGYITENTASKRVLQKCHMKFEGIRRSDFYFNDRFYDIAYHYILNPKHQNR